MFGIPLIGGALITALDAFLLLLLMNRGFRFLEAFVIALLIVIAVCFGIQIVAAAPPVAAMLRGFVPSPEIVTNPEMLYIAIGIIGATVMPHNLYLHSSIVQTRAYERSEEGRRDAIKWATADSTIALMLALFINAAILIVAAATFHSSGHSDVAEIGQAFELLSPLLGLGIASTLFAVALLASGLNSTVTATLAGQIVMEGFLHLRLPGWARRLITRGIAIVPVVIVTALLWRARDGQSPGVQPGHPVDATAVRGATHRSHPPAAIHSAPAAAAAGSGPCSPSSWSLRSSSRDRRKAVPAFGRG